MDFSAIKDMYVGSHPVQSAWLNGNKVWERKPSVDVQAIMDAMVLWYDIKKQGATNESMTESPVLVDHSGNGHDATCYNFAWSEMSGIGGYAIPFDNKSKDFSIYIGSRIYGTSTYNILTITGTYSPITGGVFMETLTPEANFPSFKIKVTGLEINKGKITNYNNVNIVKDGTYEIPALIGQYKGLNIDWQEEREDYRNLATPVIIEQLPQYPNALVSDGVDDYAIVEELPILSSYSVVTKEDINYNFTDGILTLFRNENSVYSSLPLFSFLLFNRILTTDEINWVKTNLMS